MNRASICEVQPDGFGNTDNIIPLAVAVATDYENRNFANTTGSLSRTVFHDADKGGTLDGAETGLENFTVKLEQWDGTAYVVIGTTTTAADGTYAFTALRPSDGDGYTITQTQPDVHTTTVNTKGDIGSTQNDPADTITTAPINSGTISTGNLFGEAFAFAPVKSIVSTSSAATTGHDVGVDEVVRYRLVINVPCGSMADFQLQDHLPAGMRFLNDGTATLAFTGAVAATGATGATAGVLPDAALSTAATTNNDTYGSGTAVFFKLGTVTNTGAGLGGEFITIEFNAVVLFETGTQDGVTLDKTFTTRFDITGDGEAETTGTPSNVVTTLVIATPDLVITKTTSTPRIDLINDFTYTITLRNTGDQNATGVTVIDTLPPYLAFISATNGGIWYPVARTITWTGAEAPELLSVNAQNGETITFTVTVKLPVNSIAFGTLTNTVTAFDDGNNRPDRDPSDNTASVTTPVLGFLYDRVNDFSRADEGDDDNDYRLGLPIKVYRDAILPIAPIYSGAAEPGSTLEVALYNADGDVIGRQTVLVDTGGNWMASFPGTIMKDYPQSVVITQTPASSAPEASSSGYNLRPYYATAINAGHFFRENLNVARVTEQTSERVTDDLQEALSNPIGFEINTTAYESLASPGQPSGR